MIMIMMIKMINFKKFNFKFFYSLFQLNLQIILKILKYHLYILLFQQI